VGLPDRGHVTVSASVQQLPTVATPWGGKVVHSRRTSAIRTDRNQWNRGRPRTVRLRVQQPPTAAPRGGKLVHSRPVRSGRRRAEQDRPN
jgi:hypothetical protein